MFTREKKLIAILLTAALAFTMNTSMFAAVGEENVEAGVALLTTGTTPTQPTTGTNSDDKDLSGNKTPVVDEAAKAIELAISTNKACNPVNVTVDGSYVVSYNSYQPYFGKKFNAKNFASLGITVSINGKTYKAIKGKIVRDKGGTESVSNSSIVITKLETGAPKDAQKAIKKATKATAKKKGVLRARVFAFRLNDETAKDLGLVAKGKAGKYTLKFTLGGKKQTISQKKDSFGNKNVGTWTVSAGGITVSTNDIQGSASAGKFANKTK